MPAAAAASACKTAQEEGTGEHTLATGTNSPVSHWPGDVLQYMYNYIQIPTTWKVNNNRIQYEQDNTLDN